MTSKQLLDRARESMGLGGPPAPWEVIGQTSIRTADGQEMIFESYRNGKPHSGINSWTRQRICDGINLLPELVAEIERLTAVATAARALVQSAHDSSPAMLVTLDPDEPAVSERALTALESALEAAGYGMTDEEFERGVAHETP